MIKRAHVSVGFMTMDEVDQKDTIFFYVEFLCFSHLHRYGN